MRKLIFIFALALSVTSCSKQFVAENGEIIEVRASDFIDLRNIANGSYYNICVDKRTGVLYMRGRYRLSPIMKADGTCLTLEEWEKENKIKAGDK